MKIIVHGKKVKITNAINDYIENKIGKLDKYLENPNEVTATVSVRIKGKDQTVEVTIPVKRYILRAEDTQRFICCY
jgi:putative sigma-54 modulation protein